jgi:hypothetical protein
MEALMLTGIKYLLEFIWKYTGALILARISWSRTQLEPQTEFPLKTLFQYNGNGKPPPLKWKASHPSTISRFKAEVTCSRGHGITLRSHSVLADGRVVPSIVCKAPGCDYHEVVRLEGWTAGSIPAYTSPAP